MTNRTTIPVGRKILFAAIMVGLVLGSVELVLRVAGVAPAVSTEDPFVGFAGSVPLFEETVLEDGTRLLVTDEAKRGHFNVQSFSEKKPDDVLRVFCLGGSTTFGRPYSDATSFSGWMRQLLPQADGSRRYEVINAGGISYASYRVTRIVEEVLDYDPDVLVIYTGHNEFLEERTYGKVRDRSPLLRAALDVVNHTRIGSLAASALGADTEAVDGRTILPTEVQARLDHSAGLDLYSRDDALASGVLRHYEKALRTMVAAARAADVGVVLVTPASNLADFSPFKSEATPGVETSEADARRRAAAFALDSGDLDLALEAAREAAELDPRHAGTQFVLGEVLREAGRFEEAAAAFTRARDEDVCTLRAPSPLVDACRRIAEEAGVTTVDAVELFEVEARRTMGAPLVGDDFFLDHVHPTIDGHRLLAVALVDAFVDAGWIVRADDYGPAAIDRVAQRVHGSVTEEEHARALANLALVLSWAGKGEDSRKLADRALATGVEDPTILLMAARHATLEGEHDAAHAYYRRAVGAAPNDPEIRSQMGFFLSGIGAHEAAIAQFYLASLMQSKNETYHQRLGFALERAGHPDLALAALETAARLAPQDESLVQRVEVLRARIPAAQRFADLEPVIERHPSGYPKSLTTTRDLGDGTRRPDGMRVTWYDDGELESFAHLHDGHAAGISVRWDRDGREIERSGPEPRR